MQPNQPNTYAGQSANAPACVDSERALLGALLSDPAALDMSAHLVRPEHFSEPLHADLFNAILVSRKDGLPSTPQALQAFFGINWNAALEGMNKTFGQYVAGLIADGASPYDIKGYAKHLRSLWGHRSVAALARDASGTEGETSPQALARLFERVDGIRLALTEVETTREAAGDIVGAVLQTAEGVKAGTIKSDAATTGYPELDREIVGYRAGDLVLIGGRPGMGKTTLATCSALRTAESGAGVFFGSLELTRDDIGARMLADMASTHTRRIHFSSIMSGRHQDGDLPALQRAAERINSLPLEVDDPGSMTIGQLRSAVLAAKAALERKGSPLKVVFLDHLANLVASNNYKGQRVNEIQEITQGLRALAKELRICIVLLVQLNRGVEHRGEDKRPVLSDLRDSGALEQDADTVLFPFRPEYYLRDKPEELLRAKNRLEIIIEKNRKGPTTTVDLFADIAASMVRESKWLSDIRHYGEAVHERG